MKKTLLLDTNILVRLIVKDSPKDFKKALALVKKLESGKNKAIIPEIVIFETVFTLQTHYGYEKEIVVEKVKAILSTTYIEIQSKKIFNYCIDIYSVENIGFVDSFLLVKSRLENFELKTLDKKLAKLTTQEFHITM